MPAMTMAGFPELSYDFYAFNDAGQVWKISTSSYVTWLDADFLTYRIPAVETSVDGEFQANAPSGATHYNARFHGATLAESYEVWRGNLEGSYATSTYFSYEDFKTRFGEINIARASNKES